MNRPRLRTLVASAAALALGSFAGLRSTHAQPPPTSAGTITGSVEDASSGVYLPSAVVRVAGTALQVITDQFGRFNIKDVPPGPFTLVVTYSGMKSDEVAGTVSPGTVTTVSVAMQSEVVELQAYKVEAGLLSGTALAENTEKEAPNVEAVVDSAAYGPIAQANIGDFLRMLPGVTGYIDNVTIDKIQVRGMPEEETTIEVDGTKIADSNNSFNSYQRSDTIPANDIGSAEVIYAPTPDQDADSLGGVINLNSKSGWDVDHQVMDLEVSANYNLTYKDHIAWRTDKSITPNVDFDYGNTYSVFGGKNNLGVYFNAGSDEFFTDRSHIELNYQSNWTPTTPSLGNLKEVSNENYDFTRNTGDLRLDYRTQLGDEFHLTMGASRYRYYQATPENDFESKKGTDEPGSTTYNWIVSGAQYDGLEELDNNLSTGHRLQFWGESKRGPWTLDYDWDYSESSWNDNRLELDVLSNNKFNYTLNLDNASAPVFTQTSGVPLATDDFTNVSSSTFDAYNNYYDESVTGVRIDLQRSFDNAKFPFKLKTGYRLLVDDRSEDSNEFVAAGAATIPWSTYLDTADMDRQGTLLTTAVPVAPMPEADVFASAAGVKFIGGNNPLTAWQYNPTMLTPNSSKILSGSLGNTAGIEQAINAGYIQGDVTFDRLNILGGVRFEATSLTGTGVVENGSTYGPLPASGYYGNWFPSVNLRYQLTNRLVFHGSYNTTIGRPNEASIIPNVDFSNGVVTFTNPGLKPERGENFDLRAEYYFQPAGLVALGVFEQKIDNFIVTDTGFVGQAGFPDNGLDLSSYIGDQGTTSINGGDATTRGLDVDYDEFFRFLPGCLSGLGAFFNFTWQEPSGYFGAGTPVDNAPDFRKQSGNLGLAWVYGRWDIRLNCNYVNTFLYSISTSDPSSNQYKLPVINFNGFLKYRVTKNLQAFLNVVNFTRNNIVQTNGVPAEYRLSENDILAAWASAGFKLSL